MLSIRSVTRFSVNSMSVTVNHNVLLIACNSFTICCPKLLSPMCIVIFGTLLCYTPNVWHDCLEWTISESVCIGTVLYFRLRSFIAPEDCGPADVPAEGGLGNEVPYHPPEITMMYSVTAKLEPLFQDAQKRCVWLSLFWWICFHPTDFDLLYILYSQRWWLNPSVPLDFEPWTLIGWAGMNLLRDRLFHSTLWGFRV